MADVVYGLGGQYGSLGAGPGLRRKNDLNFEYDGGGDAMMVDDDDDENEAEGEDRDGDGG